MPTFSRVTVDKPSGAGKKDRKIMALRPVAACLLALETEKKRGVKRKRALTGGIFEKSGKDCLSGLAGEEK
jgi:hypothetical protein